MHCGAEPRPGFADTAIAGVAVDLCRAIAIAVLGPAAKVEFHLYDSDRAFDAVRQRTDAVAFLTRDAISEQDLSALIQPGPTVFVDAIGVMVDIHSPIRRLEDLGGHGVCLMIGSAGQQAIDDFAARSGAQLVRHAFQEDVEMLDAYNTRRCEAAVGESTYLADMRGRPGINRLDSRLLPMPLALQPVIAATPAGDAAWAAMVFWVIDTLLRPQGGPVIEVKGLRPGWQQAALSAVGSYDAMIRRNLTQRLGLAAGPNALWPSGVLLAP